MRGEALVDDDVHAAEGVDDLLEAGEVDEDDVVDPDAGERLHRLHHQRDATPRERGVDFGVLVASLTILRGRHMQPGVPRDRDQLGARPVFREVGEDDRVGTRAGEIVGVTRVAAENQQVHGVLYRLRRTRLLRYV